MSTVAVLFMAGADSLALMMIFLFVGYGFLGLVLTTTAVLSLEDHGAIAGTASALIGALQFGVGAAGDGSVWRLRRRRAKANGDRYRYLRRDCLCHRPVHPACRKQAGCPAAAHARQLKEQKSRSRKEGNLVR